MLERIEQQDLDGKTSSQVLSDVAHRLMSLEACAAFDWPYAGIAARLQQHPAEIQKLVRFRQAVEAISLMGVEVLPATARDVELATKLSQTYGLMSNDALVVSIMQEHKLKQLASHDSDFDRVPAISRFGLV